MNVEAKENANTWVSWDLTIERKKATQGAATTSVQGGNLGHEDKISFWLKGEDSKKVCKCIETLGKVTKGFRVHIAN